MLRSDREETRRREAKERQAESDKLTPSERLLRLDRTFGTGLGATKERAKLAALIESTTIPGVPDGSPAQEPAPGDKKAKKARARRAAGTDTDT